MMREHELHADLRVEFQRPLGRFGSSLYIVAVNNSGDVTHVATVIENGELDFQPYELNTIAPPTLLISDALLTALVKAVQDLPAPSDDATHAHLADTIGVRDRLLTMVERSGYLPPTTLDLMEKGVPQRKP